MNEQMDNTVAEASAGEQAPAPENTAAGGGTDNADGAMSPEERSRQAARRRAAEQRARELKGSTREQRLRQEVLSHPLVREAMTLLEETRFKQDLERVREAYPGMTATHPEDVGDVFCRLMASGKVDPIVAYEAQVAADRRRNPVPEDMVSAKSAGGGALFYSSQELDRLTDQDLRDPGIFKKAMASLARLRN